MPAGGPFFGRWPRPLVSRWKKPASSCCGAQYRGNQDGEMLGTDTLRAPKPCEPEKQAEET